MREKAAESLKRLKSISRVRKGRQLPADSIDKDTWTSVPSSVVNFEKWIQNQTNEESTYNSYIKMTEWITDNCRGAWSRTANSFWFESEKDAFSFSLRWGKK